MAVKKTVSVRKPWPLLLGDFLMCQSLLTPHGSPYPLGGVDGGGYWEREEGFRESCAWNVE